MQKENHACGLDRQYTKVDAGLHVAVTGVYSGSLGDRSAHVPHYWDAPILREISKSSLLAFPHPHGLIRFSVDWYYQSDKRLFEKATWDLKKRELRIVDDTGEFDLLIRVVAAIDAL